MVTHILKIEKYIKDKYDGVALYHLREKLTEEVTAKISKIPKTSPDYTKLSLMKSHIDSPESQICVLREEIRQKSLLITSVISLRSTREPVDQQCELELQTMKNMMSKKHQDS